MDTTILDGERSPIIITGCARSGTSMVAGIINICGAFGGDMYGPNKSNQKGMFENKAIREGLVKPFLRNIGADPKGQSPLPDVFNLAIPSHWKNSVNEIMVREGYKDGAWFYKDAKACLMWPVWNYAYPNAKWIIVRRRSADIAQSCLQTAFMNAYPDYEGWIKWINQHEERFVEMIKAGLNVKVVWPERMVRDNYEQMYETIEWLGLNWAGKEVIDFIEPQLWKAKQKLKLIRL